MPVSCAEGAREVALAHAGAPRQRRHGQVGVEVVRQPLLELAQRLAVGHLSGELGAELGLPAGTLEEQHEPAGGLERHVAPEVLLHQREREVHARGHAGRGDHVAVAHEDRVGLDLDLGMAPGELAARGPVRGGAAAVEQAGRGEQEGARADGADALRARSRGPHPGDEPRVLGGGVHAKAAGDEQRVDRPLAAIDRAVGVEGHARRRQRPRPHRDDLHRVAVAA